MDDSWCVLDLGAPSCPDVRRVRVCPRFHPFRGRQGRLSEIESVVDQAKDDVGVEKEGAAADVAVHLDQ